MTIEVLRTVNIHDYFVEDCDLENNGSGKYRRIIEKTVDERGFTRVLASDKTVTLDEAWQEIDTKLKRQGEIRAESLEI